jgi:hypothetical protein
MVSKEIKPDYKRKISMAQLSGGLTMPSPGLGTFSSDLWGIHREEPVTNRFTPDRDDKACRFMDKGNTTNNKLITIIQ